MARLTFLVDTVRIMLTGMLENGKIYNKKDNELFERGDVNE